MTTVNLTSNKDIKSLIYLAKDQGWTVGPTGSGHIEWINPYSGRRVCSSSTPTSQRTIHNIKRDLANAGMVVERAEWTRHEKARRKRANQHLNYYATNDELLARAAASDSAFERMKDFTSEQLDQIRHLLNTSTTTKIDWMDCPCGRPHYTDVIDAWKHIFKCETAQAVWFRGEEKPDVKRNMENPPARERLNCTECPDWFWISQPHLLQQHMATEHGKQPCPWCNQYFLVARGGITKHVRACPKAPEKLEGAEIVSLPAAKQVLPQNRAATVEHDSNIENRPSPADDDVFTCRVCLGRGREDSCHVCGNRGYFESRAAFRERITEPGVCPHAEVYSDGMCALCGETVVFNRDSGPVAEEPAPKPAEESERKPPTPEQQSVLDVREPVRRVETKPTPTIRRSSTATDDELWTLLEMVLDGPIVVGRESFKAINTWLDATRELFRIKEQQS